MDIPRSRTVAIGGHRTGFRFTDFTCHVTFNPTADDFIAAPLSLGYTHQLLIYRRPPPNKTFEFISRQEKQKEKIDANDDRGRTAAKTIVGHR